MRTKSAPTIKLKDYTPSDFNIRDVHLDVSLDPMATQVTTSTTFLRTAHAPKASSLVLDGDELTLVSVAINGIALNAGDYTATPQKLEIHALPDADMFKVDIRTELAPAQNKKLMGLYQSNGVYCTQCEAEGFRRITYFLDRPDVMAIYTVRLEADREACPVLLSNGNPVKKGKLPKGRHYAIWHDPHPKPSYLFAMVGGDLDVYSDKFKTASGRKVKLNIYVELGKAEQAAFAMDALKRSMVWDEEVYGCEYDLDVFNIVAVSDFNMGAMENKGLNVFNDKYVLADPTVATDMDYAYVEGIIAHEYFHNWTGNRITCRDWFQLCLKEGLTVYRDQEFSADMRSRAVQRIQQVRVLKAGQFPEDGGPLAHSVRPEAYKEINNFYTATVYQKGAELVRMLATLVGPTAYRAATDRYLKDNDGRAAMVEDWLAAFDQAEGVDLDLFARWYGQAGTPKLAISEKFDKKKQTYTLDFEQSIDPTPGQSKKKVVPIPVRFGLLGTDGAVLEAQSSSPAVRDDLIVVDKKKMSVTFTGLAEKPVVSLLRGFSAPVLIDFKESAANRLIRAKYDPDLYNRWEALNGYATGLLVSNAKKKITGAKGVDKQFVDAVVNTAFDDTLDPALRAQVLTLPSEKDIARELGKSVDPDVIYDVRKALQRAIGKALGAGGGEGGEGVKRLERLKRAAGRADSDNQAAGLRALKNAMLPGLVLAKQAGALEFAEKQYRNAKNMTDRLAALNILLHGQSDSKKAKAALDDFYERFKHNHIVIDKWFSAQATLAGARGLERVKQLMRHEAFTLDNPNRARSLLGPFASMNLTALHRADGSGYDFFAEQIVALDAINPQVAARTLTLMNNWKMFDSKRTSRARAALQGIAQTKGLSRDVQEIVDLMLS
ncbi:MAG: aminopeptidase N [Hyphomicrobiales bacterium]|nr:aminopeptidase N [Hyphomicrobiales bacterium]